MGAKAFVGDWGASKTLAMVAWLEQGRLQGMETASNFGYVHADYSFRRASEVLRIIASRLALPWRDRPWLRVAFDEAGVLFPCRGSSRFPVEMELLCMEARKFKIEIAYTVQNLSRCDLALRLATSEVVQCRRWLKRKVEHDEYGVIDRPVAVAWQYKAFDDDKLGDSLGMEVHGWRYLSQYAGLYDTVFVVDTVAEALNAAATLLESGDTKDAWGAASPSIVAVAAPTSADTRRTHHGPRSRSATS